jgi:predicted amidohydrolase
MATVRVAALQPKRRTLSYKLSFDEALAQVRQNLDELAGLAEEAARQGCRIIGFPEDTLGTLEWEAGHPKELLAFLRQAEALMLEKLGEVAARHQLPIACCNDCAEGEHTYNTAILLGADGKEIGRYRKVQPTLAESRHQRGTHFPVFEVPEIGTVGLCICYDLLFPETTRALALAGADLVFHLTLGGASMGIPEADLAAFRTRASENFIYLVVAFRGGGSMVIGPKGEILAEGGKAQDAVVAADIDLAGGREAGDSLGGLTSDFRARLFRERNPAAYAILTDPNPPALEKLKAIPVPSIAEASALMAEGLTTGADAFYEADRWLKEGNTEAARQRFAELGARFGTTWIGRVSRERLEKMGR